MQFILIKWTRDKDELRGTTGNVISTNEIKSPQPGGYTAKYAWAIGGFVEEDPQGGGILWWSWEDNPEPRHVIFIGKARSKLKFTNKSCYV